MSRFTASPCTPEQRAEQTGSALALALLCDLQTCNTQAEALRTLQGALRALAELPRHDAAAGGFAVALLPFLCIRVEVAA